MKPVFGNTPINIEFKTATKVVSVLLPATPMLPLMSSYIVSNLVTPVDPKNIGNLLSMHAYGVNL